MKSVIAMIAIFVSLNVFANDPTGKRCSFPNEYEDHKFGCCPGTESVRVSNDGYLCMLVDQADPTGKRCSFPGEYEDHKFGCCPGTVSVRVSNDGYLCMLDESI